MGFCRASLLPSCLGAAAALKGGWQTMGRRIVLCLVFLSVFLSPGNLCALLIEGSVWSTNATYYAQHPDEGPPQGVPADAAFKVTAVNFDSSRVQQPKNVTFNEFLNFPQSWDIPEGSKFDPNKKMFPNNGQGNGDEGVFFIFAIPIELSGGSLPVTITYDNGIVFSILNQILYSDPEPPDGIQVAKFSLNGFDPGLYTGILKYGALNDSYPAVLSFSTPEPGSLLLLALGVIGIGVVRRRK